MKMPHFFLIAEDDIDDRIMLEDALNENHDKVNWLIANDGVQLLNTLKERSSPAFHNMNNISVSLIILDMNMPKKSGMEVVKNIREEKMYDNIPVIGFSTASDDDTVEKFLQAGGDDFKQKPVTQVGYTAVVNYFIASATFYLERRTKDVNSNQRNSSK